MDDDRVTTKDTTRNMTEGPPMRLILGFSLPLLLGFLMQQFYNVVSMIVVGRFIGVEAFAGVGVTGGINFMTIGLCVGLCSGLAIPVAQKFGAGDYEMMRRFIANGVWLSIIFTIILTALTVIFCEAILTAMRTPADIYEHSYSYMLILFCGIPTVFLYNFAAGIMRSIGDSKTPMKILMVSTVIHLLLSFLFVVFIDGGTAGVAYSTNISQLISGLLCLIILIRKFPILRLKKDEWRWQSDLAKTSCKMAIPMGIQYSITAIGSVILQSAVNTLGSAAAASVAAAIRVSVFFSVPFETLGNAMTTYAGQNVGAGRLDRLDAGLKASVTLACLYSIAAYAIIFVFGRNMTMIFVDPSEAYVLDNATLYLRIMAAFYIPLALVNIYRFMIQGMGYGMLAIIAGVCELIARTMAAFILVPLFGFVGAAFASPLAWLLADMFLIPAYHYCKRQLTEK